MNVPHSLWRAAAALLFALSIGPLTAQANDWDAYPESARVARVSFLEGAASIRSAGTGEWQDLDRNMPVFDGDEIYTDSGSRLEVQIGGGRYLRLGERTSVVFDAVDEDEMRFEVAAGSVELSLRDLDRGESYEVNAPAAAARVREAGVYRVDVGDDGDTRVVVEEGEAEALGVERSFALERGEVADFDYNDPYAASVSRGYGGDAFDSWTDSRDSYYDDAYARSSSVSSIVYRNDIYGLADLVSFGSWFNYGRYGYCWRPSVGSGWQPYSNGYWQWYPGYGYTWVSNDPWGWAPYHYGRWQYDDFHGWIWVPWSQYCGGYNWQPAHVYWYPYGNGYAWVPLAPNEPLYNYRRVASRHGWNDRYRPVNLRRAGAAGFAPRDGDGRLRPVRGPIDRDKLDGVSGVYPTRPAVITGRKPQIDVRRPESLRARPIVVSNPSIVKPRGPIAGASGTATVRPVRPAKPAPRRNEVVTWSGPGHSGDAPGRDRGNPTPTVPRGKGRDKGLGTPVMVDVDRPASVAPEPEPKPREPQQVERPRREGPERPDRGSPPRVERPKPRLEQPVGPSSGGVRERPRREREREVEPARPVAPRREYDQPRPKPERPTREEVQRPRDVQPARPPKADRPMQVDPPRGGAKPRKPEGQ